MSAEITRHKLGVMLRNQHIIQTGEIKGFPEEVRVTSSMLKGMVEKGM